MTLYIETPEQIRAVIVVIAIAYLIFIGWKMVHIDNKHDNDGK